MTGPAVSYIHHFNQIYYKENKTGKKEQYICKFEIALTMKSFKGKKKFKLEYLLKAQNPLFRLFILIIDQVIIVTSCMPGIKRMKPKHIYNYIFIYN